MAFQKAYMTKLGSKNGDCLRACVASIFGRNTSDIPDFCEGFADDFIWFERLDIWCSNNNLPRPFLIENMWIEEKQAFSCGPLPELCIVNGCVDRSNDLHCTVWGPDGKDFVMVHDPLPGGNGIDKPKSMLVFLGKQ